MADGRQAAEWARTASLIASVGTMLGGKPIDPADLIPERYRDGPAEKPPDDDGALGFELLRAGLAAVSKQWAGG